MRPHKSLSQGQCAACWEALGSAPFLQWKAGEAIKVAMSSHHLEQASPLPHTPRNTPIEFISAPAPDAPQRKLAAEPTGRGFLQDRAPHRLLALSSRRFGSQTSCPTLHRGPATASLHLPNAHPRRRAPRPWGQSTRPVLADLFLFQSQGSPIAPLQKEQGRGGNWVCCSRASVGRAGLLPTLLAPAGKGPGRLQWSISPEGCFPHGMQSSGARSTSGSKAAQGSGGLFMQERAGILQRRPPCSRSASHSCWARLR